MTVFMGPPVTVVSRLPNIILICMYLVTCTYKLGT